MVQTNDIDDSEYESNNESVNGKNRIVQEIMSCTAIAAYDALVDNNKMAGVQKISNSLNDKIIEEHTCDKH